MNSTSESMDDRSPVARTRGGRTARHAPRRVIRWRWAIGTLIALGVMIPAIGFWHQHQMVRVAMAMQQRADDAERDGDLRQATRYLYRCLQLQSDDTSRRDVTLRIARLYDRLATTTADRYTAITWFYRAVALAPQDLSLQQRLAELFCETDQHVLAEKQVAVVLRLHADDLVARRVEALAQYGQLRRGRPVPHDRVAQSLRTVQQRDPTNVAVAEALAFLYREMMPPQVGVDFNAEADQVIDSLVRHAANDPRAHVARYNYRLRYHGEPLAADLDTAVALAPENAEVLLASAESAQRHGDYRSAAERFRKLVAVDASDARGALGLGECLSALGERENAIRVWRDALRTLGAGHLPIRVRLADVLLETNELAAAEREIVRLDESIALLTSRGDEGQRDWVVAARDLLRAKLHIARREFREAVPLLQRVATTAKSDRGTPPESMPAFQAWWMLGQCWSQLQQWEDAATCFHRALQIAPQSNTTRFLSARAWAFAGRDDQALTLCEQLIARPSPPESAWLLMAQLLLRQQIRRLPTQRDWVPLQNLLTKAEQALPDNWELPLIHANLLLARDGGAGVGPAVQRLVAEESRHPQSILLWSNLVFLYERMGLRTEADRAMERLRMLQPDAPQTRAWQAALYGARGDFAAALGVLNASSTNGAVDSEQWLARARLFVAYQQGDLAEVARTLERLLAERPLHTDWLAPLADVALLQRDDQALARAIERLHQAEGDEGIWWRYFQARRDLAHVAQGDRGAWERAKRTVEDLQRLRSWWPGCALLRGLMADSEGHSVEAIEAYIQSVEGGFSQPQVFERIVELLQQDGRFAEADHWLQQLQQQSSLDARLLEVAWSAATERGHRELSLRLAQERSAQRPTDATARAWLAQMLGIAGDLEGARAAAQEAERLQPPDIATWSGILSVYLRLADAPAARRVLETLEPYPGWPPLSRHLVFAESYQQLGDRESAARHYEEAIRLAPDDVKLQIRYAAFLSPIESERAQEVLRKLIEIHPDAREARQLLASWLMNEPSTEKQAEGRGLLQGTASSRDAQRSDRRLEALLLLRRGQEADTRAARDILQQLVADPQQASSEDRWMLATVLEQMGDIEGSRAQLRTIAQEARPSARHLAAYVDFLLRHKDWDEARRQLELLERQAPQSVTIVGLRGRWMAATGGIEQLDDYVEHFATDQLAALREPTLRRAMLTQIAELFEGLSRPEAAERWWQRLVTEFPDQQEQLVRFWLNHQRFREPIQYLVERAEAGDDVLSVALLARVWTHSPEELTTTLPEWAQRSEQLMSRALNTHGNQVDLLFAISNWRLRQNNVPAAIVLLRQLTSADPRHVTAWNNLAALLSDDPTQLQEALRCVDHALAAAGRPLANLLDTKAIVLLQMGQNAEAARLLDQALVLPEANDPRFHFHLALARLRLNEHDAARAAWKESQRLGLEQAYLTSFERQMISWLKAQLAVNGPRNAAS